MPASVNASLRKATVADIKGIHSLLVAGAAGGLLLPRSLSNLYSHVRDFHVLCDEKDRIIGCSAISIMWEDVAEVRSLYLDASIRGKGLGRSLVEAGLEDSTRYGIKRVFTLTYQITFFQHLGFVEITAELLPQKVWTDCIHCPKYPDCDEVALMRDL